MPFSWGSSQPRDWTRVSCTAGRFFSIWATREAPQKEKENVFIQNFTLSILPSWCSSVPFLIISYVYREFPLAILLEYFCEWQILLIFLHLRTSWFPLHSWRIFSLGIEFWISTSFLFQHLKNVMQIPSWSLWFLMRSLLSFELSFPSVSLLFLSSFCCLRFSEIWLWCILVWISLGLSCLELTQLLESQLMSGEGCSHYFSMYVFSPTYSLFPRSNNKSIRSFAIVSQFPEALFFPFSSQSIFSLFFRVGILYCSVFKLTDSFIYLLHSAIDSIQWVFNFWLLYFSVLNFHFVFFLYLLFLYWDFLVLFTLSTFSFVSNVS